MKARDKILSDIYKVELSEINVELAIGNDLTGAFEKMSAINKPAIDTLETLKSTKQKAKQSVTKSISEISRFVKGLSEEKISFEAQVKALGIDLTKIPQPKMYSDRIIYGNKLINQLETELKQI
jgi:hypothetical protein